MPSLSLLKALVPTGVLQIIWGEGITDADYFIHTEGGDALQVLNSCSLYEEKHELKHFCQMQLRVHSKESQCFMEASLELLRTLMYYF